ncbi:hypothetical protein TRFO_34087 [Tritrichomonas foetus]|uniref:Uncharacterized protein n=1 Tax=Tritrichomonas foetus TaxID=1144522 RepID=A0A1J4JL69_9EUKA|nr:hypothetical protein TRFO_34087 [Tritrichomonas foetus]|eukprot:OHS99417.1 hypothetical protein TRFO_34087 [Tritrichomonas foetus]
MLLFLACIIPNSCSLSIISEQFYSITTPYTDNAIMISVCSFFNIKADALVIVSGSHTNILEMRMCSIAQAFSKSLIKFEGKDFDLSYCCQEDSSFSENLVKATCRSGGHYRYFFEDCIVECECKDTIVKLEMEDSTLQNNHVNITNIKSNGLNNYFDYLSLIDFESQYIVIQNGNYNELVSSTLSQAALQFYDILNCSFKTMESVLVGKIENSAFFYNKIDKLYNDQNLFFF